MSVTSTSDLQSIKSRKKKLKQQGNDTLNLINNTQEFKDSDIVSMVSEIDSKFENSILSFMDLKNNELQDEIGKNNSKNDELQSEKTQLKLKIDELNTVIYELTVQQDNLKQEKQNQQDQLDNLNQSYNTFKREGSKYQQAYQKLTDELDLLKQDNTSKYYKYKNIDQENLQTYKQLQEKIEQIDEENEAYKQSINKIEDTTFKFQCKNEIQALQSQITHEIESKLERVKLLQDENSRLKEENKENDIIRKRLQEKNNLQEKEVKKIHGEIFQLNQQSIPLQKRAKDLNSLKSQNNKVYDDKIQKQQNIIDILQQELKDKNDIINMIKKNKTIQDDSDEEIDQNKKPFLFGPYNDEPY